MRTKLNKHLRSSVADTSCVPADWNSRHNSLRIGQERGKAEGSTAVNIYLTSSMLYRTCKVAFTKHKFWSLHSLVLLLDKIRGSISFEKTNILTNTNIVICNAYLALLKLVSEVNQSEGIF